MKEEPREMTIGDKTMLFAPDGRLQLIDQNGQQHLKLGPAEADVLARFLFYCVVERRFTTKERPEPATVAEVVEELLDCFHFNTQNYIKGYGLADADLDLSTEHLILCGLTRLALDTATVLNNYRTMSLIVLLALNCNRTEQETTNNETDIAEQETRKEKSRCRGHCRAANRHAPAMCDFPRRRRGKRPRWNPPRKGGGKSDKGAALAHNEDAARAVGRAKRKERAALGYCPTPG